MCKNYIRTEFHSGKYRILLFSLISPYPAWSNPMVFGLKYACGCNSFLTQIATYSFCILWAHDPAGYSMNENGLRERELCLL